MIPIIVIAIVILLILVMSRSPSPFTAPPNPEVEALIAELKEARTAYKESKDLGEKISLKLDIENTRETINNLYIAEGGEKYAKEMVKKNSI